MKAVIMAGGRATRFDGEVEKALLEVGGRRLMQRSVEALRQDRLSGILVAVSPHTPRTRVEAKRAGLGIIETLGKGYHQDVMELLEKLGGNFLTLNVDVPFITEHHVAEILRSFDGNSLAAVVPTSRVAVRPRTESVGVDSAGEPFTWVGLNIVTPNPETRTIVFDDPFLAVNINDEGDLVRANRIASEKGL